MVLGASLQTDEERRGLHSHLPVGFGGTSPSPHSGSLPGVGIVVSCEFP